MGQKARLRALRKLSPDDQLATVLQFLREVLPASAFHHAQRIALAPTEEQINYFPLKPAYRGESIGVRIWKEEGKLHVQSVLRED